MKILIATICRWILTVAPAILVRWYWTESRLRRYVSIDVRPRGRPLELSGGDPSSVDLYLRLWNALPYALEIEHAEASVRCNGELCQPLTISRRIKVPPISAVDVRLRGGQGIDFGKRFERLERIPPATLLIHAELKCSMRRFTINNDSIGFVPITMINVSKELTGKIEH